MNPFDNILSPQLLDMYDNAIRGLINSLKLTCWLYNPVTKWVDCSCSDSILNNSPNPFIKGKLNTACPNCGGNQKIEEETIVETDLCIVFDYKKFDKIANITLIGKGDAYTLCEINDVQNIKRARYVVLDKGTEALKTRKFKMSGEPSPIGFRNNFYLVLWEAI